MACCHNGAHRNVTIMARRQTASRRQHPHRRHRRVRRGMRIFCRSEHATVIAIPVWYINPNSLSIPNRRTAHLYPDKTEKRNKTAKITASPCQTPHNSRIQHNPSTQQPSSHASQSNRSTPSSSLPYSSCSTPSRVASTDLPDRDHTEGTKSKSKSKIQVEIKTKQSTAK